MKRYDLVIFDFDGTLADSAPWFRSIVNEVARRHRFRPIAGAAEEEELRRLSSAEIMRRLGIPAWRLPLIALSLRRRAARDADKIALFDGAAPLIASLAERGVVLAIVSSNRERTIRRVLGPALSERIAHYACSASYHGKAPKLRAVLKTSGVAADRSLAIGDEPRDVDAARKAGLAAGAVDWGYAASDALAAAGPDRLFRSFAEIESHVLGAFPADG